MLSNLNQRYLIVKLNYTEVSEITPETIKLLWNSINNEFDTNLLTESFGEQQERGSAGKAKLTAIITKMNDDTKNINQTLIEIESNWYLFGEVVKDTDTLTTLAEESSDNNFYPLLLVYKVELNPDWSQELKAAKREEAKGSMKRKSSNSAESQEGSVDSGKKLKVHRNKLPQPHIPTEPMVDGTKEGERLKKCIKMNEGKFDLN